MEGEKMNKLQPKKRGKIRLQCGRFYYRNKRYLKWLFGKIKFAKVNDQVDYPFEYFEHHTPLIRHLRDMEMHLQYNKIHNLRIATAKVNNVVIMPGETFSYWKLIGKPTMRKGYKNGLVLVCGTLGEGMGGGLCQLFNLIYWMALHTPLTIVERYRHSYDVFPDSNRILPFGSGATCVYNYRDLMIKNETTQPFQIKVWLTSDALYGCIKGAAMPSETYEVYEKEHIIKQELFGKYSRNNTLYRKIFNLQGEQVADELVAENHALMMYDPFIEQH